MLQEIILASGSQIRHGLLKNAGVAHQVIPARVDERTIREAMHAEAAIPRDIADRLAEEKARKVSLKNPGALVLGCDQVLDHASDILEKPADKAAAIRQLKRLSGARHSLLSAVVICEDGRPIWRHVGQVRLQMHRLSDDYVDDYVARNWDSIKSSVGSYKLEEEGARLFQRITGDYFTVLGLPLIELLSYLSQREILAR